MIWLSSARQTLRRNVSREIDVHTRAERAEVRWPRPSPLARLRWTAKDGHWEREGKIKGAARVGWRNECSCGFAAARGIAAACRFLHASCCSWVESKRAAGPALRLSEDCHVYS